LTFLDTYLASLAFFLDDVGDHADAAPEFYPVYLLFFGIFQNVLHKISISQYPLIVFLFPVLAPPVRGTLGPDAKNMPPA
jgi:hypothetical protein